MTIDLTSAGNRGLETLDSMADAQSVLKNLNAHDKLIKFQDHLLVADKALRKVDAFIRHNNTLEADVHQPPTVINRFLNTTLSIDPGMNDTSRSTLSNPFTSLKTNMRDSRIFQSGIESNVLPIFAIVRARSLINSFI